jgi:glycosyltransferase involved in cell wall biosynthesis
MDVPQTMPLCQRLIYRAIVPKALRRAALVITVSEFSRRRLQQHFRIPEQRIRVTYEGPKRFDRSAVYACDERIVEKYCLSVTSALPHKNTQRLINAWAKVKVRLREPFVLVIAGRYRKELVLPSSLSPDDVVMTGYVPDEKLEVLYRNASVFAFPSLYEGFGIPVLEAMQAGVPVACSSAGSLPEIVGDAAVLFNPLSEDEMAGAILNIIEDQLIRGRLVRAGKVNLRRFNWDQCARETLSALEDAVRYGQ